MPQTKDIIVLANGMVPDRGRGGQNNTFFSVYQKQTGGLSTGEAIVLIFHVEKIG